MIADRVPSKVSPFCSVCYEDLLLAMQCIRTVLKGDR